MIDPLFKSIGFASDHAGFALKCKILEVLSSQATVVDFGCFTEERCDYPDSVFPLARKVQTGEIDAGIAVCGTGFGMSIAANRLAGVRAVSLWSPDTVEMARAHNNCNLLCLGSRILTEEEALKLVDIWMSTPFAGGRHADRISKIDTLSR